MPLPDDKAAAFAEAIADTVPLFLLAEVVDEQGIVADFDSLRKGGSETPDKDYQTLARTIVDAYNARDLTHQLANSLYHRGRRDDALAKAISPFVLNTRGADAAKEARLASRAATLRLPELRQFLDKCEPCVCLVAGFAVDQAQPTSGTGFLVGPDLVLTARHVLRDFIKESKGVDPNANALFAFFDHLEGEPITDPRDAGIKARRVPFADDWLLHASDEMPADGQIKVPDAAQMAKLKTCLDVALVRLAEPVGLYTRAKGGGARRLWLSLPANGVAANLRKDDRIIIPQHPHGHTLQIDFGRLKETDQSTTRIRYTTESDKGTSGAPCFNHHFNAGAQQFNLVGLHNADYRPDGVPILNQAIRFDHILSQILAFLGGQASLNPLTKPSEVVNSRRADGGQADLNRLTKPNDQGARRLWSVSLDNSEPRVIVGRTKFLDWIERSAIELPALRSDRVYAGDASKPRAGRSFSLEILQAARRGKGEPAVVLGLEKKDQVPATVPAFLAAIADQLRIPQSVLEGLPPRAAENLPPGSKDGDKLNKWASEQVPRWFEIVLQQHRERVIDRRDEARDFIKLIEQANLVRPPGQAKLDPPAEIVEIANSQDQVPDTRNRWPLAWIVLDNLTYDTLSKDVADLIAGLCGDKLEEAAVPEQLRRLRWIFLGHKPDFVIDAKACIEPLDPMTFGIDAMIDCVTGMAAAFNTELSDEERAGLKRTFRAMEASTPTLKDPMYRLESLQILLNAFALDFLQEKEAGG